MSDASDVEGLLILLRQEFGLLHRLGLLKRGLELILLGVAEHPAGDAVYLKEPARQALGGYAIQDDVVVGILREELVHLPHSL